MQIRSARKMIALPVSFWWVLAAVTSALVLVVGYFVQPAGAAGWRMNRLLLGLHGVGLVLACAFLGIRKKLPTRWWLPSAKTLREVHVLFGFMSVPVALFHAGFLLRGRITAVLMLV